MVLRRGADLENLGKISQILDDGSPVRLGMTGAYKKRGFQVAGRIQLRWADGIWNEWFLIFDDNDLGWLGEGQGMFFLTFPKSAPTGAIPAFDSLSPGQNLTISGKPFQVSWKETSRCISGQGELPFAVHEGWESPSVDLMGPGGAFLTFDYSDDPPSLYVGEAVMIESLALDDAMALPEPVRKVETEAMACLSCGAPYNPLAKENASWACPTCGAVHEVLAGKLRTIYANQTPPQNKPALELGMVGTFEGFDWTVIGIQRRAVAWEGDSESWQTGETWDEYLLWNPQHGQRWLTESEGHWNWLRTVPAHLAEGSASILPGSPPRSQFRHFATYQAMTTWVVGEFDWQVKVGDRYTVTDHVAPPWVLGCERNERETIWSAGQYLDRSEVLSAFERGGGIVGKVALPPPPNTIGPNQPNPYALTVRFLRKLLVGFLGLALVIHLVLSALHPPGLVADSDFTIPPKTPTSADTVLSTPIDSSTGIVSADATTTNSVQPASKADSSLVRPGSFSIGPFDFPSRLGNLELELQCPVSNDWISVDVTLTDRETGRTWIETKEIAYYSGTDSDGGWSEGSTTATIRFDGLEKGSYLLELETDRDPAKTDPLPLHLSVHRNSRSLSWFVLTCLLLCFFPLIGIWRTWSFEARRWADSDHPTQGSSE